MAFFNEFPHTRTYDSDLGWLIKNAQKTNDWVQSIQEWLNEHGNSNIVYPNTVSKALQDFTYKHLAILGDSNALAAGIAGGMKTIFGEWFPDMTIDNYSASGSGFLYKQQGENYMEQSDHLTGTEDYVILWTGYNDKTLYTGGDILGSYAYESILGGINVSTLLGAVKYTLLNIKIKCPYAKIIVITKPILNSLPNTYDEALRNTYKAICDIYGVGYINAGAHCTIVQSDMLDSLHFNEICLRTKIAPIYINAILNGGDAVNYNYPSLLVPLNVGASVDNVKSTFLYLANFGLASVSIPVTIGRLVSFDGTGNYGSNTSIQSGSITALLTAGAVGYIIKVLSGALTYGTVSLSAS